MSDASLPITYVRLSASAGISPRAAALPRWLCAVQAIVAYQCLLAGVDKLLNANFAAHLPLVLQQSVQNNPYGWYVGIVRSMVLPHSVQYASVLAWSETTVGAVLLLSALVWALHPHAWLSGTLARVGCVALAAVAIINLNDFLLAGSGLPWIDPAHAYQQAMQLDAIVPLIALALLGANLSALRKR